MNGIFDILPFSILNDVNELESIIICFPFISLETIAEFGSVLACSKTLVSTLLSIIFLDVKSIRV